MDTGALEARFREFQEYVGWRLEDARRVGAAGESVRARLPELIDDFYDEIERHPAARTVVNGGPEQIVRLKGTLNRWIWELFGGRYDFAYVERRWRVGWRHVEIGLDQVFTNLALSRLRAGLLRVLREEWKGTADDLLDTIGSLNRLLDLDLAIIEDAYQTEYSARLQRGERLATLGQIAGGVAHELRNPLNVVKTSVYFLLHARAPTVEKQTEHLRRIERHVEVADNVITSLLSFARLPAPDVNPVDLEALAREVLELNPPGTDVEVAVDCPKDLPAASADADQLKIVLGNLVRNARDAMPQGGKLSIAGRAIDDAVELTVSDTGVGIPAEDLARIMEPLFSTKARGLGLGLAIAKSIIDKSRGSLKVDSELGVGSAFTVRLPSNRHETSPHSTP